MDELLDDRPDRLADRVIAAVRRRRRRTVLVLALVAAVAGVALAVPALTDRAGAGPTLRPSAASDDVVAVYAAALHGSGGVPAAAEVRVRRCARTCTEGPMPAALAHRVERVAGTVHIVVHPPIRSRFGNPPVIVLGAPRISGDRAVIDRAVLCGLMCGHGVTLTLVRHDGAWAVRGQARLAWVSWLSRGPAS